jgi:hypothetical protein
MERGYCGMQRNDELGVFDGRQPDARPRLPRRPSSAFLSEALMGGIGVSQKILNRQRKGSKGRLTNVHAIITAGIRREWVRRKTWPCWTLNWQRRSGL